VVPDPPVKTGTATSSAGTFKVTLPAGSVTTLIVTPAPAGR
jgi:hypothetical protein